ncbi:MAG: type II secretion system protein [Planctomycetota bacterium]|nr:MAG: type II secretion system protein [Planctomycetota bacterium]
MRRLGFTLIEVMTVISIILVLAITLVVAIVGLQSIARKKATVSLMKRIELGLQSYYGHFNAYPPDGHSETVTDANGNDLSGSSALLYYLAWKYADGKTITDFILEEVRKRSAATVSSGKERLMAVNGGVPYLPELRGKDIRIVDGRACLIDGWGKPIQYDNILNGGMDSSARGPDPRELRNGGEPFHLESYDLWSHGKDGVKPKGQTAEDDITRKEASE